MIYQPYVQRTWQKKGWNRGREGVNLSPEPNRSHVGFLKGHFGCVNAISLSPDGKFLVSGGDDKRILLWRVLEEPEVSKPVEIYNGHENNVFCVQYSADSRSIYSSGLDGLILKYDVERPPVDAEGNNRPTDVYSNHEDCVQKISSHPHNVNVLLSCSADGSIRLWDTRTGSCAGQIACNVEQTCVQFNPVYTDLFGASGMNGFLRLYDMRKSFTDEMSGKSPVPLKQYVTVMQRRFGNARKRHLPNITSFTFHPSGKLFIDAPAGYAPCLYGIYNEMPMATFANDNYRHLSTTKTFSFGSNIFNAHGMIPNDNNLKDYVYAGSDNAKIFAWKIPESLFQYSQYHMDNPRAFRDLLLPFPTSSIYSRSVFSPKNRPYPVPIIDSPCVILDKGHYCNVNSTLCHPHLPFLFSCGVEKSIKVFSPEPFGSETPIPYCGTSDAIQIRYSSFHRYRYRPVLFQRILQTQEQYRVDDVEENLGVLTLFDIINHEDEEGFREAMGLDNNNILAAETFGSGSPPDDHDTIVETSSYASSSSESETSIES